MSSFVIDLWCLYELCSGATVVVVIILVVVVRSLSGHRLFVCCCKCGAVLQVVAADATRVDISADWQTVRRHADS
jgi:hypothetical protein